MKKKRQRVHLRRKRNVSTGLTQTRIRVPFIEMVSNARARRSMNLTEENILRVALPKGISRNSKECQIMIDQSRAIDNGKFRKYLGDVPKIIMQEIEKTDSLCWVMILSN